jgi:hypothetical protein
MNLARTGVGLLNVTLLEGLLPNLEVIPARM